MSSQNSSYSKENNHHGLGPFAGSPGHRLVVAFILASLLATPELHAAIEYQRLKSFGFPELAGGSPSGSLLQGSDGAFYGTTWSSGINAFGTVFKVNADGSGYSVLHRFYGTCAEGIDPSGGLVEGSDGAQRLA